MPAPATKTAILGFTIPAYEAMRKLDRPFVGVVPPGFEEYMEQNGIEYVTWDFERFNDQSTELAQTLQKMGVGLAVPMFEECVEWAGALNGVFRDDPRLFTRYLLFRDKAMMKRRAQMTGVRVGVFEEAEDKSDVERFFRRVNKALAKIEGDPASPVHLKPLAAAGCKGHRMIRRGEDVETLTDEDFPCLLESHLDGQEFSCEVFIHAGKIRYLNITEYVRLGYSNIVPAGPSLEQRRPLITKAVQDLIDAFNIEYGMIHPEFFITADNKINFGEVAARVPGGHIFELIEKACGFDPFAGFVLAADPASSEEQLNEFFPDQSEHDGYAGCLMVYPSQKVVTRVDVPDELLEEDYYERHNLYVPVNPKVAERVAFGDHYGTIYFRGDDSDEMRRLLEQYEKVDFYAGEEDAVQEQRA